MKNLTALFAAISLFASSTAFAGFCNGCLPAQKVCEEKCDCTYEKVCEEKCDCTYEKVCNKEGDNSDEQSFCVEKTSCKDGSCKARFVCEKPSLCNKPAQIA